MPSVLDGITGGPGQIFESKLQRLVILALEDFGMHLIAFEYASTFRLADTEISHIVYCGMTNEQGEIWLTELMKAMRGMIAGNTDRVIF